MSLGRYINFLNHFAWKNRFVGRNPTMERRYNNSSENTRRFKTSCTQGKDYNYITEAPFIISFIITVSIYWCYCVFQDFAGRGIVIIRNPYEAILSMHNFLYAGHHGTAPSSNFKRKGTHLYTAWLLSFIYIYIYINFVIYISFFRLGAICSYTNNQMVGHVNQLDSTFESKQGTRFWFWIMYEIVILNHYICDG